MLDNGKAAAVIAAALIAGLLSFFVAADFFTSDRVLAKNCRELLKDWDLRKPLLLQIKDL